MYLSFYGLHERPFKLTSNPRYLLLTQAHAEALSAIEYGLTSRVGLILLTGEAGTGKTTVVRAALVSLASDAEIVTISNPGLSPSEFLQQVGRGFGLAQDVVASKPRCPAALADE